MARATVTTPEVWSVIIAGKQWTTLHSHLFPGDHDEHGAILRCGIVRTPRGVRLLVKDVMLAEDGVDYVPGDRGYRKLTAAFVADNIDACAEEELAYLAVHNHGGSSAVAFSRTDMASHERGYPALLDINGGIPVGALVIATGAVAGDIWSADGIRHEINYLRVVGRPQLTYTPQPTPRQVADPHYDRQTRVFGDRGQAILAGSTVAIVGLGGIGSLISEYLARLGVGHLVLIDPDKLDPTNIPRVVGSRRRDAMGWLRGEDMPALLRAIGERLAKPKVDIAARVAREAAPSIRITRVPLSVIEPEAANLLRDCDHIFLAADSALARRLVNSLGHQYLIPFTQVGSKVSVADGQIADIFAISRMSTPGDACLQCNGLIPAWKLTEEATSEIQRRRQRYVDDDDVHAPSVISLNAVAASRAVDDWLMSIGGLVEPTVSDSHWVSYYPLVDETMEHGLARDPDCRHCGWSRFARGDQVPVLAKP